MQTKDMTPFIENVKKVVASHRISEGAYTRLPKTSPDAAPDEYGCADAANILYTVGDFPRDPASRAAWVETLRNMQDPETGFFTDKTHCNFHTTAHCTAALELFDARPKYGISGMDKYKTKENLYAFLDGLDWDEAWSNSHYGAGIYASLHLSGESSPEWEKWYFEWLKNEADPETGLWRKGYAGKDETRLYRHMAGTFHYLFNHEYANMPLMYPEKLIDTCLYIYNNGLLLPDRFEKIVNFIQIDWVYCITRALRQCGHRYAECRESLLKFADSYLDFLLGVDPEKSNDFDDIHMLFGSLCCVAELQQFLKGKIYTEKPLKLVLDRRPFI